MATKCPQCKKPVEEGAASRPFCSPRCKDIDLGKWLNEEYRISRPMTPDELVSVVLDENTPGARDTGDAPIDFEYDA